MTSNFAPRNSWKQHMTNIIAPRNLTWRADCSRATRDNAREPGPAASAVPAEQPVTFGGNWQGIFGVIWPVHRCRCLKSCAPMTEVGCTGYQPRLAGTPRWRVSAASDPVKHVLACASVSGKFARNQESTQGLVLLAHSFACSFQRFTTAGGSSARSGRCACGTVPGKAGFHGFGPVVRRVSAVARRPAAPGRSGCPARGPHRRAAGRPGRGRAAVSRPSGRRR